MNYRNSPVNVSRIILPHLSRGDKINISIDNKIVEGYFIEYKISDTYTIELIVGLLENYHTRKIIKVEDLVITFKEE